MFDVDWFSFENKDRDFPVYNENPHIPKSGWVLLFVFMCVGFIAQVIPNNEVLGGLLFCLIILIPFLYYLKWDIRAIFQKPKAKEVGLAVLLFIGYLVYAFVIGSVLDFFSLTGTEIISESQVTINMFVSLIFSMMGEELIKLIPFLFFMRLIYKYSDNRKLAIVGSMLIVMVCFGLLHAADFKSIVSVLLLQGLGSIFEFYGYIKTKNVLISYITHLCTDALVFALILLGTF